jgi:hypothetical protein
MMLQPGDTAALGGTIEVEGQEVAELPNGQLLDFMGPSHEQGGIDASLPKGTDIFSKRIRIEGKTMAERKKARNKRLEKMEKLAENSKSDAAIKKSYERTLETYTREEEADLSIQGMMNMILGDPNEGGEKAFAGIIGDPRFKDFINQYSDDASAGVGLDSTGFTDFTINDPKAFALPTNKATTGISVPNAADTKSALLGNLGKSGAVPEKGFDLESLLGNLTGGDAIGQIGNLISTFAPLRNTLNNRATDTPNVNEFKDFGVDALASNDLAQRNVAEQKVNADRKIELGKNAAVRRGRNSSRGVNTMRAMDLAGELNANLAQGNTNDIMARQMMQLLAQRSGLENQQDQAVMAGEQQRDLADRQDKDNFATQKGRDLSTIGTGVQQIGKDANDVKEREIIRNLLNQLSKYGITLDKDGNVTMKKTAGQ